MTDFETIQEEVLTELFGTTNFASTIRGLFTGKTPDSALNPPKKVLDRKLNAANRIQQASGFLSDKSLNDVDIPTFLRKALEKGADASKPEQSAMRATGYKVGPPGHNKYGKVGGAADTVGAETLAAAEKRKAVYSGKSYASIRETLDQTIRRLLNEMRMEEWRVTPQMRDADYAFDKLTRAGSIADKAYANGSFDKRQATGNAANFVHAIALAHAEKGADAQNIADDDWTSPEGKEYARGLIARGFESDLKRAAVQAQWSGSNANHPVPNSVKESYVYDEALINQIVEELLEAFMYDPKHHFTGGKEGGVPGPLSGMKFDTLQRALDAGSQLTPSGQPMGDWNHVIVAPEEAGAKKVDVPQPPAEAAPEGDVQDRLDPMKRIQPVAAPVK